MIESYTNAGPTQSQNFRSASMTRNKFLSLSNPHAFYLFDRFLLGAAFFSFLLSVSLWFTQSHEQAIFVGLWVPSVLGFGIYFRLMMGEKQNE